MVKAGKELEQLVAAIQQQLAPTAVVEHDVKLMGKITEVQRQIDVLVRQPIGQYEMRIALECKDHAKPVDVKGVEEFHGLLDDVGVEKGAMVCPAGFSSTAKKRAKMLGIDLYKPVDTEPHKWTAKVKIPVICDFLSAGISFGIRCSAPYPFKMQRDFWGSEVFDPAGNSLGTIFDRAIGRWNNGEFPTEPGDVEDLPIFDGETHVDNGYGLRVPVTLYVGLRITSQLYFGFLPLAKVRGLRDEHTGGLITNAFTTGHISPEQVTSGWKKIDSKEATPMPTQFLIRGLVGWARND